VAVASGAAVSLSAPGDRHRVAELLGRPPAGSFRVVVRRADGDPVVIENGPFLDDGRPMPTRYWLVGAEEARAVSRLESAGGAEAAEREVPADALLAAHRRYEAERDALVSPGHVGPRPSGGVGGTKAGVKCLHAHVAWWLAGGDDPVGAWAAGQLGLERPRPAAACDLGTNSTRLLVVDGTGRQLERPMSVTRLGQGVDATGRLHPDAIARTLALLRAYRERLDAHGVGWRRASATSAARDAANRDELLVPASEVLGVEVELLSGEEEGSLALAGAIGDLSPELGPFLVVDIGGGSTELVRSRIDGDGGLGVGDVVSMPLGCVRLTERVLGSGVIGAQALAEARALVDGVLDDALAAHPGLLGAKTIVGVAGTVTTLAMLALGLEHYDPAETHRSWLDRETVARLTEKLAGVDLDERRSMLGDARPRAEVIVGGCVVLGRVLDRLGADRCMVSETDILDGLVAPLVGRLGP
jgi:exopolyphosphatase/guanosine-5'-triphosphate,3'-diphosphate pyrophosphatase